MIVTLIDIENAGERIASGEKAYEFQTGDRKLHILGPACGFGADYLMRLRREGLYAESLEEASKMALARNLTITGIWFVKRSQVSGAEDSPIPNGQERLAHQSEVDQVNDLVRNINRP